MRARLLGLAAGLGLIAWLAPLRPAGACTCPVVTRDQIIALAQTGVGCRYVWGGTCWDPANKTWKGADCSGYVTKCWQVPAASATTDCLPHYYTTSSYYSQTTHWSSITRASLLRGDALVYRSGDAGHIVLFDAFTSTSNCYEVYEARGTAYGIVHRTKCPDSTYQARRRHNLSDVAIPTNTPPKGYLDDADCTSVRGWAFDADVKDQPIDVHVYFNAPAGQPGGIAFPVLANQNRPDLLAAVGSTLHGFELPIPPALRDGQPHSVRAYAIDNAGGENPELIGGPKSITCNPLPGDSGPGPSPLEARAAAPDGSVSPPPVHPPPTYEIPDDNRPEHDLELTGGCGCRAAGDQDAGAGLSLAGLLLWLLLGWCRRGE